MEKNFHSISHLGTRLKGRWWYTLIKKPGFEPKYIICTFRIKLTTINIKTETRAQEVWASTFGRNENWDFFCKRKEKNLREKTWYGGNEKEKSTKQNKIK